MWPDTWSGEKKIYFYSWYGTASKWKLPENWADVNIGLRDYPESRAFFQKLVETKSIYRRDWNPETNRRDKRRSGERS